MKKTLRTRLVMLVVAALVPLFGLSIFKALHNAEAEMERAKGNLQFAASLAAASQERVADSARQVLMVIASLPGMQDGKNVDCDRYFSSLIQHHPGYANLGILGRDGYTRCHALGSDKKTFLGDRAYFRNAITQHRFVAGPYALGRLVDRPVMTFAQPVIGADDKATGVIFASRGEPLAPARSCVKAASGPIPRKTTSTRTRRRPSPNPRCREQAGRCRHPPQAFHPTPRRMHMPFGNLKLVVAIMLGVSWQAFAAPLDEPIKPLPASLKQDPARAEIGRELFHDVRLSVNNSVSCASCHDPAKGGADGRDRSVGFSGKQTAVNAPTVFNSALNFTQFWNGRADSLEAQIQAVVENPVEMGSKWADVIVKVSTEPGYKAAFALAYKDGVTKANIQNALATYERTLITPNSRFDKYLRGDPNAISGEEKAGYAKFKQYGCVSCHQGVNVGGNMFQKFGVMGDYFAQRGKPTEADLGRYLVTRDENDKHVFKVPSLRNIALTAPYFHDGSAKTLDDAVDVMFKYQLGRVASRQDKAAIIKFLNTLTDEPAKKP